MRSREKSLEVVSTKLALKLGRAGKEGEAREGGREREGTGRSEEEKANQNGG